MEYKEVMVFSKVDFLPSHEEVMRNFLTEFDNHIYFETKSKNEIRLFVNALDVQKFKESAIKLKAKHDDKKIIEIVDIFVEAVDGIGSYTINNKKRVFVDFNKERKVKDRKLKSQKRIKTIRPTSASTVVDNELPKQYENQIICGDSLDVLKKMPDNCVDLMITSPPYNFGLDYAANEDDKKWEDYFNQLFKILYETKRVLKSGGRLVINIQPLFSDYIPTHHIVSKYLLDIGMLWKGEILWEKNNYNCKYTSWGSWKSPSSPYLKYTWEFIEIFCKDDLKHSGRKEDIDIGKEEFKKWVLAKWSIAPERKMKQYGHPAMFPEQLVERSLKLFSFKNDIILDVFNGAGTTTSVAHRLDRRYIGIDISKKYCDLAKKRLHHKLL